MTICVWQASVKLPFAFIKHYDAPLVAFPIPECLCLWPLESKAVFPLLVPNATLQNAQTPTNTRKALISPRPCRFTIAILPNLNSCALHTPPYRVVSLSGALLPLRCPVSTNKISLMIFLVQWLSWLWIFITDFDVCAFLSLFFFLFFSLTVCLLSLLTKPKKKAEEKAAWYFKSQQSKYS